MIPLGKPASTFPGSCCRRTSIRHLAASWGLKFAAVSAQTSCAGSSQAQLVISLRRDRIAPCAIIRRAAGVACNDAGRLAFDIAVDASHPGIDFEGEQADANLLDVVGPVLD